MSENNSHKWLKEGLRERISVTMTLECGHGAVALLCLGMTKVSSFEIVVGVLDVLTITVTSFFKGKEGNDLTGSEEF